MDCLELIDAIIRGAIKGFIAVVLLFAGIIGLLLAYKFAKPVLVILGVIFVGWVLVRWSIVEPKEYKGN